MTLVIVRVGVLYFPEAFLSFFLLLLRVICAAHTRPSLLVPLRDGSPQATWKYFCHGHPIQQTPQQATYQTWWMMIKMMNWTCWLHASSPSVAPLKLFLLFFYSCFVHFTDAGINQYLHFFISLTGKLQSSMPYSVFPKTYTISRYLWS